jgi:hypothetical protein
MRQWLDAQAQRSTGSLNDGMLRDRPTVEDVPEADDPFVADRSCFRRLSVCQHDHERNDARRRKDEADPRLVGRLQFATGH